MKFLSVFLLLPIFVFSQSLKERQKHIAISDVDKVETLKMKTKNFFENQKKLINNYKLQYPYKESENKSLQRIYNGIPIFYTINNKGASITIGANAMYLGGSLGLNVTGLGITAGVWDGGRVKSSHQELVGRDVLSDGAADLSDHATHVTGTIIASGVSPTRRGIAYGANTKTFDWNSDFDEMINFGHEGYLVSNHSYGYVADVLPNYIFGSYDDSSLRVDDISYTFPYYQIVTAAGNDRESSNLSQVTSKGGYDLVSGMSTSKNGITVAAVEEVLNYFDETSVMISSFSNYGPTDDGRIKPDIAAKGVNVSSCVSTSNTAYTEYSGTSMAAPGITGLIVLLQKHYSNLNPAFMKAATVKGLICHSAKEAGEFDGPDYQYGWGLASGENAANTISGQGFTSIIQELTLKSSQVFTKTINIAVPQKLTATISWTDPVGVINSEGIEDDRSPRLINNLDLKIIKNGEVFYPWKLNPDDPSIAATRDSDNEVDNIEKVQIDNAQPGIYTIQVTHKGTLKGGLQSYSLIASGTSGLTLSNNKFDFDNDIVLFPNPVSTVLNFSVPRTVPISALSVFDVLGNVVNTNSQLQENAINVSRLANGIYFAKFSYDGKFILKKFIKQ